MLVVMILSLFTWFIETHVIYLDYIIYNKNAKLKTTTDNRMLFNYNAGVNLFTGTRQSSLKHWRKGLS